MELFGLLLPSTMLITPFFSVGCLVSRFVIQSRIDDDPSQGPPLSPKKSFAYTARSPVFCTEVGIEEGLFFIPWDTSCATFSGSWSTESTTH